jgi:hypothetical protein
MDPFYSSPLFLADCLAIYNQLTTSKRFEGVWRMASGIPQNNGVGFRWQEQTFRIHWQADLWYLLGPQLSFCAATRQELIDFCIHLASLSLN